MLRITTRLPENLHKIARSKITARLLECPAEGAHPRRLCFGWWKLLQGSVLLRCCCKMTTQLPDITARRCYKSTKRLPNIAAQLLAPMHALYARFIFLSLPPSLLLSRSFARNISQAEQRAEGPWAPTESDEQHPP
jgi:hypothetical protein